MSASNEEGNPCIEKAIGYVLRVALLYASHAPCGVGGRADIMLPELETWQHKGAFGCTLQESKNLKCTCDMCAKELHVYMSAKRKGVSHTHVN